jgi:hypothetical protein
MLADVFIPLGDSGTFYGPNSLVQIIKPAQQNSADNKGSNANNKTDNSNNKDRH